MFGDSLKTDKQFAQSCNIDFIYVNENDETADISHLGVYNDYLCIKSIKI